MTRNEKPNREWLRNSQIFWHNLSAALFIKLSAAAVYLLGAAWVWSKREAAAKLADRIELASPVMEYALRYIFSVYLLAGASAMLVVFLYPFGRKAAEEGLQQVGLVNHKGDAPRLLRKRRDRKQAHIAVWEFDNQGVPLKEWEDKREKVETALDITIVSMKYGRNKRHVQLYAVPARTDLPDRIPWKEAYLSRESFVLALGEACWGQLR